MGRRGGGFGGSALRADGYLVWCSAGKQAMALGAGVAGGTPAPRVKEGVMGGILGDRGH